ncbi:MAG TPA: class I SAM-dependent methyltransferase, partial [Thermoleophilaceae bacterium]|nr:class I SAM-dependent methyltransferase [Thermoleophilaceae bacterium]
SENQPGFRFSAREPGSREFFEEVAAHRYSLEPAIKEMARFEDWRGRDVLEAGCGIGTDAVEFARAGARYTGIDMTPAAIALARRRFSLEGLEGRLLEGSVTALPFPDSSFDLVYSNGVLHHVEDTERALGEIHRVLRPGGTALVMVYHRNSLNYRFTIMIVRRALAAVLVLPGAVRAVARLTGESREVIEGHRRLIAEHGLAYLRDRALFLSNNTDGPGGVLSKVYSSAEGLEALRSFSAARAEVRYLNLRLYPAGARIAGTKAGRRLERRYGWHLWLRAVK